ncbi:MAG: beta-lactamase hydrolase domain-containing protein [Vulcanimicrobiaceae bacterium]
MKNEATIDNITVGGQPSAEELRSGRFQTVVNVRLDGEPGNETAADLEGSGIAYTAVPYTIDTVTREDIAAIRAAVDAASGPVLIHCMGGTRAAVAAAIIGAARDGSGAAGALRRAVEAGYGIAGTPYAAFIDEYFAKSR